jgi:hypothetical protein
MSLHINTPREVSIISLVTLNYKPGIIWPDPHIMVTVQNALTVLGLLSLGISNASSLIKDPGHFLEVLKYGPQVR